jgi:hypothetical protein
MAEQEPTPRTAVPFDASADTPTSTLATADRFTFGSKALDAWDTIEASALLGALGKILPRVVSVAAADDTIVIQSTVPKLATTTQVANTGSLITRGGGTVVVASGGGVTVAPLSGQPLSLSNIPAATAPTGADTVVVLQGGAAKLALASDIANTGTPATPHTISRAGGSVVVGTGGAVTITPLSGQPLALALPVGAVTAGSDYVVVYQGGGAVFAPAEGIANTGYQISRGGGSVVVAADGAVSLSPGSGKNVTLSAAPILTTQADAAAVNQSIFFGSDHSGNLCQKVGGTVTDLAAAAGGGAASDMLSILTAAEIAVTGATTLTLGRMHVCTGTTADYTVTLPAAAGNARKFVGVRMGSPAQLTKMVTVDGNGAELIDNALTRTMGPQETAILFCDGSDWFKWAGRTIPMSAQAVRANVQSISHGGVDKVLLDAMVFDPTGQMVNLANTCIDIKRTGIYLCIGSWYVSALLTTSQSAQARVHTGPPGSITEKKTIIAPGTGGTGLYLPTAMVFINLTAGDRVEFHVYQTSGAAINTDTATPTRPTLIVYEQPAW